MAMKWNPHTGNFDLVGTGGSVGNEILNSLSTGIIDGGIISINALDDSKFDISSGVGVVVDNHSDPANPVVTVLTWDTITVSGDMSGPSGRHPVYITMDKDYNVHQSLSPLTPDKYSDEIYLGIIAVLTTTGKVVAAYQMQSPAYEPMIRMRQFFDALGAFNIEGNVYSPNGANLKIDRSAGKLFRPGANYSASHKVPDILDTDSVSQETFFQPKHVAGVWAYTSPASSDLDPEYYDNLTNLVAVPAGKWTIRPIYYYPNARFIPYGQAVYDTKEDAIAGVGDAVQVHPILTPGEFVLRGYIIVQQGATDLSDTDQAEFIVLGKFGAGSGGGGGGGEINTASNIGTAGVGLYDAKVGMDLQFKNIEAGTGIDVTDYPGNKTVRIAFSGTVAGGVPVGGIIMWSGTIATIPATWALCDGTTNSPGPDLRDKFIVGATSDDAGAAKTNVRGTLEQSGAATGHSHSGHANLTHAGLSIGDHTGLTHSVAIANHPDLTHAALSHAASTFSHADHSVPSLSHSHAAATLTHADHSLASFTGSHASNAAVSIPSASVTIASGTHTHAASTMTGAALGGTVTRSVVTTGGLLLTHISSGWTTHTVSNASFSGTHASQTGAIASNAGGSAPSGTHTHAALTVTHADHSVASFTGSHAAATLTHGSHEFPSLSHQGIGTHVGTDYGVHTITQPADHGTAGTVTHSYSGPSDHSISSHDTVSHVPSFYALAFIQRMS
jgi:hypothetical protein